MTTYDIIYIITNIFGTYIIYKLMGIFFNTKDTNKITATLSYIAYFIIISLVYLLINIPVIMMLANIIFFFLLTLNYKSTLKQKLIATVLIYLILICVEVIVIISLSNLKFDIFTQNPYSLSYSLMVLKLVTYLVTVILNKNKHIRQGEKVPLTYWIVIVMIPLFSLYIILLLLRIQDLSSLYVITGVIFVLLINLSIFYLYDVLSSVFIDHTNQLLLKQQNKYYDQQLNLMKSALKSTSTIKHDLKNHLSIVYHLVQNGETTQSLQHISDIIQVCNTDKEYSHTGNIVIDSILNFKLQLAEQEGIHVSLDITIPEIITIPSFDLVTILGNLLDNAIDAARNLEVGGFIHLQMKYGQGMLILKIDNPFQGDIVLDGNKILTTKEDDINHGIGLESVKSVLEKYNGLIEIEYNHNIFSLIILMYID